MHSYNEVAGSNGIIVVIPACVEVLHLINGRQYMPVAPALSGSQLRELHIDLSAWTALPVRSAQARLRVTVR